MNTEEKGHQLHDKASRRIPLTAEERRRLEEWYDIQDLSEAEELGLNQPEPVQAGLQAQIEVALEQLVKVTNRIQQVVSENETLRHENAELRRQLTHLLDSLSA